jgi:uncharacterized protein YjiS (DUF1127 family)
MTVCSIKIEKERKVTMLFAALIERLRIWRREREILVELRRLRERDLFDIGIHPADIRAIARRAARA